MKDRNRMTGLAFFFSCHKILLDILDVYRCLTLWLIASVEHGIARSYVVVMLVHYLHGTI